jgi:hypothetical protein
VLFAVFINPSFIIENMIREKIINDKSIG